MRRTILDVARDGRRVRKIALREKGAELQLRVGPGFDLSKGLQDESVTEDDRSVALFGLRSDGVQLGVCRPPHRPQFAVVAGDKLAMPPAQFSAPHDSGQQL